MKKIKGIIALLLVFVLLVGCGNEANISTDGSDSLSSESGQTSSTEFSEISEMVGESLDVSATWSAETHSDEAEPNYDVVFNQDEVMEIYITIDPEDWETMNTDLQENVGNINANGGANMGGGAKGGRTRGAEMSTDMEMPVDGEMPGMPVDGEMPEMPVDGEMPMRGQMEMDGEMPVDGDMPADGEAPMRGQMEMDGEIPVDGEMPADGEAPMRGQMEIDGEMPVDGDMPTDGEMPANSQMPTDDMASITTTEDLDYEPIWVEATITYEEDTWEHVGIRFKGNSSLSSVAQSDNSKYSFKLDFDEFEDIYLETDDQRFYGFKQLNLNNNFNDASLLREKVGAEMFDDFGLISAETAFAAVYVDYGEGLQYFGLYTLVEEVDDTVIETALGDDDGNIYKPDGDAASFAEGTFDESEMEKKNNEEEADYSDVEALYTIINSDLRLTDEETWMEDLEDVFNVDGFLKWLAVNTVIQNWDTYGNMTHNYYLYNDPETGLLNWIPWDNNEAFSEGKGTGALSLELSEVSDSWPLISYITEIDEYRDIYDEYMEEFVTEVFNEEDMTEKYETYYELIKDYAYAEESGYTFISSDSAFDTAVDEMIDFVSERNEAVDSYLD